MEVGQPPLDLTAAGSLREICGSAPGYTVDDFKPRVSYHPQASIALPPPGDCPHAIGGLMSGEPRSQWVDWQSSILRTPDEAAAAQTECGVSQPYSDSKLIGDRREYAKCIRRLLEAKMIRLVRRQKHTVGVFFVLKKNGAFRVIFDTRVANSSFK